MDLVIIIFLLYEVFSSNVCVVDVFLLLLFIGNRDDWNLFFRFVSLGLLIVISCCLFVLVVVLIWNINEDRISECDVIKWDFWNVEVFNIVMLFFLCLLIKC